MSKTIQNKEKLKTKNTIQSLSNLRHNTFITYFIFFYINFILNQVYLFSQITHKMKTYVKYDILKLKRVDYKINNL